jgi:hypothetical protein
VALTKKKTEPSPFAGMEAVLNLKMSPTLQTRCEKLEEKNKVLILTAFNDGCVQTPFHLKETHIFVGGNG